MEPKIRVEIHDMETEELLFSYHTEGAAFRLVVKEYPEKVINALEGALEYARTELFNHAV